MPPPLILVTTDRRALGPAPRSARVRPPRPEVVLKQAVVDAVRACGGLPLLLPPVLLDPPDIAALLCLVSGVVVTGGAFDIHPRHYGQRAAARIDRVDDDRTDLELAMCAACLCGGVPILGICGGLQALAVAAGGSLLQDIGTQVPGALEHEQPTDPAEGWHPVSLTGPLAAARAGGEGTAAVNSTHHQAVDDPGELLACGHAPDGIIEAAVLVGHPLALGVQWHPELLNHGLWPYQMLVDAARAY